MTFLKNPARALLGLAVALSLSFASHAGAADAGKVTGKLTDKDGKAVSGATVRLMVPPEGKKKKEDAAEKPKAEKVKPVAEATTGSDGAYELKDVPAGEYVANVRVKKAGFAHDKVTVKAGETATLDLKLQEGKAGGKKDKA